MVFCSPFFVFVFLPIVLFLSAIAPEKRRNIILLFSSIFFYSWGNLSQTGIFIFSITSNYFFGLWINSPHNKREKLTLTIAVASNLLLLGYFKYFNFVLENLNSVILNTGGIPFKANNVPLPIGISFFTFHALSYIIDVYRKKIPPQKNFLDLALYISFFPQLIAGPIVRYIDIADQFKNRKINIAKVSDGIQRFIFGFAKKIIVANTMASIADQIFGLPIEEITPQVAWLGALAYAIQIYFDFSGYSDMAIGLAKIFGFEFPENFDYPYIATSIKDFWRRWHISLSTWFRDFLYIPLGGNKNGELRTTMNLLIVFFCTGLWHGASWTFIFWGIFHGVFLLLERKGLNQILLKTWRPIQITYTFLVVIVGWVFFREDTFPKAIEYVGKMGFIGSIVKEKFFLVEYLNAKIIFLFVFAIIYSFKGFRLFIYGAKNYFLKKNMINAYNIVYATAKFTFSIAIFIISIVYLAGSTYNPFIYFRF